MEIDTLYSQNRFFITSPSGIWTDFHKAKYYRKLIESSQARLDVLCSRPAKNRKFILQEKIAILSAEKELKKLEVKTGFS